MRSNQNLRRQDKETEHILSTLQPLETRKRNPMGRTTEPKDVANIISLMLEPEADFINCSIIYTDGGEHRSGTF